MLKKVLKLTLKVVWKLIVFSWVSCVEKWVDLDSTQDIQIFFFSTDMYIGTLEMLTIWCFVKDVCIVCIS